MTLPERFIDGLEPLTPTSPPRLHEKPLVTEVLPDVEAGDVFTSWTPLISSNVFSKS